MSSKINKPKANSVEPAMSFAQTYALVQEELSTAEQQALKEWNFAHQDSLTDAQSNAIGSEQGSEQGCEQLSAATGAFDLGSDSGSDSGSEKTEAMREEPALSEAEKRKRESALRRAQAKQRAMDPTTGVGQRKLRILFGGMDGRLSTNPLSLLAANHEIVGIIHSEPRAVKQRFLVRYARAGKTDGNLKRYARYLRCQYYEAGDIYSHEFLSLVKYLKPDIFVLSNFSIILPPEIFEVPRYGTINLHLGRLPHYRGSNPLLWTFYNADRTAWACVHQVDAGEDTGDILGQTEFPILPNITSSEFLDDLLPQASKLLLEVVNGIAAHGIVAHRIAARDMAASGVAEPGPDNSEAQTSNQEPRRIYAIPQEHLPERRRARFVPATEQLIPWEEWSCERVGAFLRGASVWYDPCPIVPGFFREYEPGVAGDPQGKPGTVHRKGLWRGWISCSDGIVPFRLRPSWYELLRLIAPFVVLFFMYGLFYF